MASKTIAAPLSSSTMGENVAIGNKTIPTADLVSQAVTLSGLDADAWNALGQPEIDKRLSGVLEGLNASWRAAQGSSSAVVADPLRPGFVTLRMAQAVTVHLRDKNADGKTIPGVPYSLKLGVNHDVPAWVADEEFVQENLEK